MTNLPRAVYIENETDLWLPIGLGVVFHEK